MSDESAKIDSNRIPTLLGVSDDGNEETRRLVVDSNGRLKVSAVVSGIGSGSTGTSDTTDATTEVIDTVSTEEETAYYVNAVVIAREGDTNRAVFHISGLFYRASGGNITQQGSTQVRTIVASDADWDIDFNCNTTTQEIELQITGKAGTNISWSSNLLYYEV